MDRKPSLLRCSLARTSEGARLKNGAVDHAADVGARVIDAARGIVGRDVCEVRLPAVFAIGIEDRWDGFMLPRVNVRRTSVRFAARPKRIPANDLTALVEYARTIGNEILAGRGFGRGRHDWLAFDRIAVGAISRRRHRHAVRVNGELKVVLALLALCGRVSAVMVRDELAFFRDTLGATPRVVQLAVVIDGIAGVTRLSRIRHSWPFVCWCVTIIP